MSHRPVTSAGRRSARQGHLEKHLVGACQKIAAQMGAYMEVIGQRDARGAGTTIGVPDALLYVTGRCLPVEFKTPDGRLSAGQLESLGRRELQHVTTHVIRSQDEFVALINAARRGEA